MSEIVKEKDIEELSLEEQLKFYKSGFRGQHCELDGCGNELHWGWVKYDGSLYCESCFDWLIEEEKEKAQKEIDKLQKQVEELKNKYLF
jgi:hypothetical protein